MEVKSNGSNENIRVLKSLVDPLKSNSKFTKLILYSLSTIKSILSLNEQQNIEAYALILLSPSFFDSIKEIYNLNPDNEEVIRKIGETLYCLLDLRNQLKEKILENISSKIYSKSEFLDFTIELISNLNQNFNDCYQILLKVVQEACNDKVKKTNIKDNSKNRDDLLKSEQNSVYRLCMKVIQKVSFNPNIFSYILNTLIKIINSETKITLNNDEENLLVIEINNILTNAVLINNKGIIRDGINLLNIVLNSYPSTKSIYKNSKPLNLLIKILCLNSDDKILSLTTMQLFSELIEKKDLEMYLVNLKKISKFEEDLKLKMSKQGMKFEEEIELNSIMSEDEIKFMKSLILELNLDINDFKNLDSSFNEQKEKDENEVNETNEIITFKLIFFIKETITNLILMISGKSNYMKLLTQLNSIDVLLEVINREMENMLKYSSTEINILSYGSNDIISNFLTLLLNLINQYENDDKLKDENLDYKSSIMKKISECLLQSLKLLNKCNKNISDILNLILTTKNALILEFLSNNYFEVLQEVFVNNYHDINLYQSMIKLKAYNKAHSRSLNNNSQIDISSKQEQNFAVSYDSTISSMINENMEILEKHVNLSFLKHENSNEENSKSLKAELLNSIDSLTLCFKKLSYIVILFDNFPENMYHEVRIHIKNIIKYFDNKTDLNGFTDNDELIKIIIFFLIQCCINIKYGLNDEKMLILSDFLNALIIRSDINHKIETFILNKIDFHLINDNKYNNLNFSNNPNFLIFITGCFVSYIKLIKNKSNSENNPTNNNHMNLNSIRRSSIGNEQNINSLNNLNNLSNFNMVNNTNLVRRISRRMSKKVDDMEFQDNLINNQNLINNSPFSIDNSEDEFLESLLKVNLNLLKNISPNSFGIFIRENGIANIIEICSIKIFDYENSKLIVKIFQKMANEEFFKISSQYYKR